MCVFPREGVIFFADKPFGGGSGGGFEPPAFWGGGFEGGSDGGLGLRVCSHRRTTPATSSGPAATTSLARAPTLVILFIWLIFISVLFSKLAPFLGSFLLYNNEHKLYQSFMKRTKSFFIFRKVIFFWKERKEEERGGGERKEERGVRKEKRGKRREEIGFFVTL